MAVGSSQSAESLEKVQRAVLVYYVQTSAVSLHIIIAIQLKTLAKYECWLSSTPFGKYTIMCVTNMLCDIVKWRSMIIVVIGAPYFIGIEIK